MKGSKTITLIAAVALGGLGAIAAVTNPSQPAYEEYAAQRLTELVKDEVCTKAPKVLGGDFLQHNCNELVNSSQAGMRKLIAANTQRTNFIFFSIYTTDLSVSPIIPAYHFESVGALQNFYTYVAQER